MKSDHIHEVVLYFWADMSPCAWSWYQIVRRSKFTFGAFTRKKNFEFIFISRESRANYHPWQVTKCHLVDSTCVRKYRVSGNEIITTSINQIWKCTNCHKNFSTVFSWNVLKKQDSNFRRNIFLGFQLWYLNTERSFWLWFVKMETEFFEKKV